MLRKVWTAAELEGLPRAEQQKIFEESLVTDLADVPPELLEQARADIRHHIEENDVPDSG